VQVKDKGAFVLALCLVSQSVLLFDFNNASALSCGLIITSPQLADVTGGPVQAPTAGYQLFAATTISNPCSEGELPFVVIMEVRNSDGLTESISWQSGVFTAKDEQAQVGFSWVPSHSGNFELRSFAISNLEMPQVLSPFVTSNVTIASNPQMKDNDGVAYGSSSIELSNIGIRDSFGANYDQVPRGTLLLISVNAISHSYSSFPALLFIEVRNELGQTVHLLQTDVEFTWGTEIGTQWWPEEEGRYQLRAFAIISSDDPRILTPVIISEVRVGDDWVGQESRIDHT
jgi:hypothetical protein